MNTSKIRMGTGSRLVRRAGVAVGVATVLCLVAAGAATATDDATARALAVSMDASGNTTSAPDAALDPELQSSRGFGITNLSGYSLKLVKVTGDQKFEGRPDLFSSIAPGGTQRWEVQYVYMSEQNNNVFYDVYDFSGAKVDTLEVRMTLNGYGWATTSSWAKFTNNRLKSSVANDGKDITISDPKQGTYIIGKDRPVQQAEVLNNLCYGSLKDVDCAFTPKAKDETMRSDRIGVAWANKMSTPFTKVVTTEKTQSVTNSVEVSASAQANVYKVVSLAVNGKWSRSWTSSEKYTQTHTLQVQPGSKVWESAEFPMLRYTGDFTISVGGTTWQLNDVSFETPDPNPSPERQVTMTWNEEKLTSADQGLRNVQDIPSVIKIG